MTGPDPTQPRAGRSLTIDNPGGSSPKMKDTGVDTAADVYNIPYWSDGYIRVDARGDVTITPHRDRPGPSVSLARLVDALQERGLQLPVLVRFADILHDRVNALCQAFNDVSSREAYRGRYSAVYPIKVNQQRRVVEEILRSEPAAGRGQIGLEAGSKPELMAVLALSRQPGSVIICNGYKDREYIRLALIGRRLGHRVHIVVEKRSELPLILEEAGKLGVRPLIGVRARLASIGKGNWQNTGGEKSKFGLSASQILEVVEQLRQHGALDSLQLLHFHLGSQIANIRDIQNGLKECARFYRELHALGASVTTVDIGGGLGIDYEGTRSRSTCSINYSLSEYAWNVIHTFREQCDEAGIPHPDLISESGRAMTAHHAVLLTNVIDRESPDPTLPTAPAPAAAAPLRDLWRDYEQLTGGAGQRSMLEIYHDVVYAMGEVHSQFTHGLLGLDDRARAERIYLACCQHLRTNLHPDNRNHREVIDELNEKLADKLFVNFSLFQSLPDVWGIDQIFPILPLSGLNRPATRRAVIQDITCDSDGRVDRYVDGSGIETTLPLPPADPDRPMILGFFLTGAYQEILGDMHNLFGDTHSVDVSFNEDGGYRIEHPIRGDTVEKILRYVHFDPETLLVSYREQLDASDLPQAQREALLEELAQGLTGYTYLED